jgi:error-prone DNA polymerase
MNAGAEYIELRARSAFSFLEGATLPEDLAERAAELGYPALALGDRDGLYGAPRFYQAASKAGIKAIVGAELTLDGAEPALDGSGKSELVGADRAPADGKSAPSKRARMSAASPARLYVLAPDRKAYKGLCRILTNAKLRAPKGEGRVTLDDLERDGGGLICLAGGALSPLSRILTRGEDPRALCGRLKAIFGRGNLFIDLQRHFDPDQERLNRKLAALAENLRLPLLATNDVWYGAQSERALLDVLSCIRLKRTLEEAGRALWVNNERYLKPPQAMAALFRDLPEAVAITGEIAERCTFTLRDLGYRFPTYPLPPGETADSYLNALVYAGARERWGIGLDRQIRARLEHELSLIARLGLAGYFLIVWDIVRFCRENKILAQGRGSAANSAVCYALGITAVDAVRMDLLFERFLSEERGEWPDIDLDLPSGVQREKVIQYVYRRYGERGAAMTANVITYRARSAMREVAKVLGYAPEQIDRLAKLSQTYAFRDHYDDLALLLERGGIDLQAPQNDLLLDLVRRIQSLPRHLGQHSGGMVIAAGPLDEIVPLEPATMAGRVVIQWDKEDCADLGIIKIDLLGLGMLAVLEEAIPLVREHENVALDLAHLTPDDPEVYAMLQRADTIGVFQVESRAQMATLVRMKPRTFYDLVVEVAIIRPGPIVGEMVHPYLERRAGRAPVTYPHPALEPILRRTLGVPLFQEQLLRIAMAVAGFSGGEAEELRRALGFRRSPQRMEDIERRLRSGMTRNGIGGPAAEEIVRSITSFALYGFPESHAASFALIAYTSAYLKCRYPVEFFAAMLNCYPLGFYHPATLVKDAQRHGVAVRPIDVTHSNWACTVEPCAPLDAAERVAIMARGKAEAPARPRSRNALRLGLRYISGLRQEVGLRIERARAARPFSSVADLAARAGPNRRELDAMAHAGALGALGRGLQRRDAQWQAAAVELDRASLLAGVEPSPSATNLPRMTPLEETLADYTSAGLTAGPHLMAHLRARLDARNVLSAAALHRGKHGAVVKTAGAVIVRQRPGTAKGFFFITLEDETGISNAIVAPRLFQEHRALLVSAPLLLVEGVLQKQDGGVAIRATRFSELKIGSPLPHSHDFH